MNKAELVGALAEALGDTKASASHILDVIFGEQGVILGSLNEPGDKVRVTGFGVFEVKERKARTARNPKTGAVVKVGAKTVRKFHFLGGAKEVE